MIYLSIIRLNLSNKEILFFVKKYLFQHLYSSFIYVNSLLAKSFIKNIKLSLWEAFVSKSTIIKKDKSKSWQSIESHHSLHAMMKYNNKLKNVNNSLKRESHKKNQLFSSMVSKGPSSASLLQKHHNLLHASPTPTAKNL